jgi:two-component system sensor histidine kinase BaeS
VAIEVQVEPGLHLSADPIRLRQAVSNLVVNALQHTPVGGRIDLEARHAGTSVSIEVRDSGRGFGAERVDGSSGTGLGLAIAEAIVRGHGGSLEVETTGAGGVVRIVLPGPIEGVAPQAVVDHPTIGQPT